MGAMEGARPAAGPLPRPGWSLPGLAIGPETGCPIGQPGPGLRS